MNTRVITAFLVLGMVAALFFTHVRPSHRLLAPVISSLAAAQTPSLATVQIKSIPNTSDNENASWQHFEISIPKTNPPLDMHTAFLVDGHGEEIVDEQPQAWPQPVSFKYRLDSDDDTRVKDILEAQGLPIKKNLVTYKFAAGTNGYTGFNKTIRFQHGLGGNGESTSGPDNRDYTIGKEIVLDNRIISDSAFKGNFEKGLTYDQWTQPEYAPKTLPGLVHHLSVYVMFTPHQGSAVTGHQSIAREL